MSINARSANVGLSDDVVEAWIGLRRYIERSDFSGFDPYDALNSPLLRACTLGTAAGRIAMIQALKLSPVNLRPVLGVPPGRNPKALALLLEGYARIAGTGYGGGACDQMARLVQLLSDSRTKTASGHGWGYNFDWQSRAFFVPKYTPSVVCSAFAGHALLDAWERTGTARYLDLAVPIGSFFLRDLNRIPEGDSFCFSYTPLDNYAVHNANLLGVSLLMRLGRVTGRQQLVEAASGALAYTMKHQHEDGSWYYSERPSSQWIDSFHTGFNLESLRWCLECSGLSQFENAYRAGVEFYAKTFFLADGTPKYFSDRTYPIDIHAAAEAISFFSSAGSEYRPLAGTILTWTLLHMRNRNGSFGYRKGRVLSVRIPYMRWSESWMFRALAAYLAGWPDHRDSRVTGAHQTNGTYLYS